jgi:MtN3 and saliva related transmembrane protein
MTNNVFTFMGYLAATLTTFCFLPQLFHTFRTKSVGDLHIGSMILFDFGLLFWLLYGIHLHSWPMILANAITLSFQLGLLGLKLRYGKESTRCTPAGSLRT